MINPYEGRLVLEGRLTPTRDDPLEGRWAKQSLVQMNPPLGFPHSCVGPIHTFLLRNYLHTKTKGPIAQSDLL